MLSQTVFKGTDDLTPVADSAFLTGNFELAEVIPVARQCQTVCAASSLTPATSELLDEFPSELSASQTPSLVPSLTPLRTLLNSIAQPTTPNS